MCCLHGQSKVKDHSLKPRGNGKGPALGRWDSEGWQNLPLVHVQLLTVSTENAHHSLCPLDTYGLNTVPLETALTEISDSRLLVQLYIIALPCYLYVIAPPPSGALNYNPASCSILYNYNNHPELLGYCGFSSSRQPSLPKPNLLHMHIHTSVCIFVLSLFPCCPSQVKSLGKGKGCKDGHLSLLTV